MYCENEFRSMVGHSDLDNIGMLSCACSDPNPNTPFNLECTNDAVCHILGGVRVFPSIQAEDGPLGSNSHIFERIENIDPRIILPGRTVEWLKTNIQKFESNCNRRRNCNISVGSKENGIKSVHEASPL